ADDEREVPGDAVLEHSLGGVKYLLDSDVLVDASEHLVGAGFDADQEAPQPRLLAASPHLFRQPHTLVGPHGGRPADPDAGFDELVGERLDAASTREESLILEVDVSEAIAVP